MATSIMLELILVFLGFFGVIFASTVVYRVNFFISLLLSSVLSSMTIIGVFNINLILILISTFLLCIFCGWKISFRRGLFLVVVSVILFGVSILSFYSGVELSSAIGKWLKTCVVFLPLILIKPRFQSLTLTEVFIPFTKAFLFFSYFLVVPYSILVDLDYGAFNLPRFSGFFYDSNYFAAICFFLLYFIVSQQRVNSSANNEFLKRVLVLTIVLTQSFTFISFTLGLLFYIKIKHHGSNSDKRESFFGSFLNFILPSIIGLVYLFFIFYLHSFFKIVPVGGYQESVVALKMNSLLFRLMPQFSVIDLMFKQPSLFIFGYGSGHVAELFGRVLHNFYLQLLFDNGALFLIIVLLAVGYFFIISKCSLYLAFVILITNYLFDNIYMFSFTFFIFLCILANDRERGV